MDEEIQKQLIKEFGLEGLPEEDKSEAVLRISNIIFRGAILRAMKEMDDAAREDLEEAIEANMENLPGILEYLENKIPNFVELLKEEGDKFRKNAESLSVD